MVKKYELTEYTIIIAGHTLYRIQSLRSFGDVSYGDLGGYIESESNLSHIGNCWVYNNAGVYENARISDAAEVCESALVSGDAHVYGNAWLSGAVKVSGDSIVCGNVQIWGKACINGSAQVSGNITLGGCSCISGNAILDINPTFKSIFKIELNSGIWNRAIYRNTECYLISTTLKKLLMG